MSTESPRILAVDDEEINLRILAEHLDDANFSVVTASSGQAALDVLDQEGDNIDVVVLDRMMPGMDGLEVLRTMRTRPNLREVPVILQTALAGKASIVEGIAAGAFYYLTKPFEPEVLLSLVRAAIDRRAELHEILEQIEDRGAGLRFMTQARFSIRTIDDARFLAPTLAGAFPDPDRVALGLLELLLNAVEHGNLEIGYQEKTRLTHRDDLDREIARRLEDPRFGARRVDVELDRSASDVTVVIRDEGPGFDPAPYVDLDPLRAFDAHGRGIMMARALSFDRLDYRGRGNEVVASVRQPNA
ncbi:MAG: response regulator [Deltaproteobacteria bacterium]|nr:response regulator [Deltaproteobacteria bacterium]